MFHPERYMARFITLPYAGSKAHIALWEEGDDRTFRVLSIHTDIDQIEDYENLDVYRFDRQTSYDTGLPTNGSNLPVADADGRPLWVDCRIEFCVASGPASVAHGTGTFKCIDMYGGTLFVSDIPIGALDCAGYHLTDERREQYREWSNVQRGGSMKGFGILSGHSSAIGRDFFIRGTDDPRNVCELLPQNASRAVRFR